MPMNSREFELIALGHVLSRYRASGTLPTIGGKPFNINDFKARLSAGVEDADININIQNLETESNVTIVDHDCNNETPESAEPAHEEHQPLVTNASITSESVPEKSITAAGKLFDYFSRNKP